MGHDTEVIKRRSPTLDAIITMKMGKGILFLVLALGFYALSDNNLEWEYSYLLHAMHVDGSRKFFVDLAANIANISEKNVLLVAGVTLIYGSLSLVEGIGLILRLTWAAWLAIAESGFLIPVELWEVFRRFSVTLLAILIINVIIVAYLVVNRNRLFRHHLHSKKDAVPSGAAGTTPAGS